jgi:CRP-like cAMP-binding protein
MPNIHSPVENYLLSALPEAIQQQLTPYLELVALPYGKVLFESGVETQHIYFPTCAIVSLLFTLENGASSEVSVVGNEGVVGINLFFGDKLTTSHAIVENAGYAYRVAWRYAKEILMSKEALMLQPEVLPIMLHYTQSLMVQMTQTALCNRHHSILQQLCRWLLALTDRLPSNNLNMTHETIANLLGVRREGVSEAASKLQKLDIIHYSRGHITIKNREQLEQLSCECYQVVKKETARLLPYLTHTCTHNNALKSIHIYKHLALCQTCHYHPCEKSTCSTPKVRAEYPSLEK